MYGEHDKKLVNHRWEASHSQAFNIQVHNIPSPKTKLLAFLQSQYWEISVIAGNIILCGYQPHSQGFSFKRDPGNNVDMRIFTSL